MKKPTLNFIFESVAALALSAQACTAEAGSSSPGFLVFSRPPDVTHETIRSDPWWFGSFPQWQPVIETALDPGALAGRKLGVVVTAATPQLWEFLIELQPDDLEVLAFNCQKTSAKPDDSSLKLISRFKKLKTLVLDETTISEAGLSKLSQLASLEHLTFASEQFGTDEALMKITQCRGLKGLKFVAGPLLKPSSVTALTNLIGLEELFLGRFRGLRVAEDAALAVLAKLPSLRRLAFINLSSGGLERVATLPALRQLEIYGLAFEDQEPLRSLLQLTNLESLELAAFRATDETLEILSPLRQLKHLRLSPPCVEAARSITDSGLAYLEKMPSLESLYFSSSGVLTDAGLASLLALPNLKEVRFPDMTFEFTAEGLARLNALAQLEDVSIRVKGLTILRHNDQ